jgi:hypothetical protein
MTAPRDPSGLQFAVRLPAGRIFGGMTDEAPRPKRKRRRWFIACVLLFVVVTGWWYWPRGDARFVGKWKIEYQSRSSEDGTLWLSSNGSSHFVIKRTGVSASSPWWVSEGRLFLGDLESSHPLRFVGQWIFRKTWHHPWPPGEVFDIVEIGQQRVILRSDTDGTAVMTRLPE